MLYFYDLFFASTETKFKNPITKTQNNIVIFGFFHKKVIGFLNLVSVDAKERSKMCEIFVK